MAKKSKDTIITYLEWVDSSSFTSRVWTDKNHVVNEIPDLTCISIGFMVKETKEFITIVGSTSPNEYAGIMTIPKCAITKRKNIKL